MIVAPTIPPVRGRIYTNTDVSLLQGDKFVQGVIKQFFVVEDDAYGQGNTRVGGIGSSGN